MYDPVFAAQTLSSLSSSPNTLSFLFSRHAMKIMSLLSWPILATAGFPRGFLISTLALNSCSGLSALMAKKDLPFFSSAPK